MAPVFSDPISNTLQVQKFDITPDGSRAVALGTFSKVDNLPRQFLVVLDLTTTPASVAPWNQQRTVVTCPGVVNYLRAVDISPDGQYFVLTTTGAFGVDRRRLVDTASRWEATRPATNLAQLGRVDRRRQSVQRRGPPGRGLSGR